MIGKVFIGGTVVDADQARVSVFDRGFLYGDSVYEVLRTFEKKPFALPEHLDRLEQSASRIGMRIPPRAEIEQAVLKIITAVNEPDQYIRIVVTRGAGEIALDPAAADEPHLIVIARAAKLPDEALYRDGVEVAVVDRMRSVPGAPSTIDPQVKSGNYLGSVLATGDAKRAGAYEAILSDAVGRITEGASSNIFLVQGGRICTPPISAGLLEGITRRKVIEIARKNGLALDERPLWPADLQGADEAFLTSSVRGILPVVRVSGAAIGSGKPGAVTKKIIALYDQLAHGQLARQ